MPKPIVTTEPEQRSFGNRRLIVGLLVGAVIGWMFAQRSLPAPKVEVENRAHKLCQWPRHEGEALTAVISGGKVQCYELNR